MKKLVEVEGRSTCSGGLNSRDGVTSRLEEMASGCTKKTEPERVLVGSPDVIRAAAVFEVGVLRPNPRVVQPS